MAPFQEETQETFSKIRLLFYHVNTIFVRGIEYLIFSERKIAVIIQPFQYMTWW